MNRYSLKAEGTRRVQTMMHSHADWIIGHSSKCGVFMHDIIIWKQNGLQKDVLYLLLTAVSDSCCSDLRRCPHAFHQLWSSHLMERIPGRQLYSSSCLNSISYSEEQCAGLNGAKMKCIIHCYTLNSSRPKEWDCEWPASPLVLRWAARYSGRGSEQSRCFFTYSAGLPHGCIQRTGLVLEVGHRHGCLEREREKESLPLSDQSWVLQLLDPDDLNDGLHSVRTG